MKLLIKSILLVFSAVILTNCAVKRLPAEPLKFKPETAENGLIIGTLTFPYEKAEFNGYYIRVLTTDLEGKQEKKEIQFTPSQITRMRHNGDTDDGRTYLFVMEKPEGKYEIPSFRLFTNLGMATYDTYIGQFSIPFDVKKGEITYVGNINFTETMIKKRRVDGKLERCIYVLNNFEKDIKAFQKQIPTTDWRLVKDRKEYPIYYIDLE